MIKKKRRSTPIRGANGDEESLNSIKGFLKTLLESTERPQTEPVVNDLEGGNREVKGSAVIAPRVRKQMPKIKPDHELKWIGGRRTPGVGRWGKRNRIKPSKRKIVKPKEPHWRTKKLKSKKSRLYRKRVSEEGAARSSRSVPSSQEQATMNRGYWSTITGTYFVFRRNVRRDIKRRLTKQLRDEVVLSGGTWNNSHARKVKKQVVERLAEEFRYFSLEDWKNVWLACGRVIDKNGELVLAFKARSKFKKGGTRISKIDKYKPYSLTNVMILYEGLVVLYPKKGEISNHEEIASEE